jgi:hypothetical protein
MKKLKLDADTLAVEPFRTGETVAAPGTAVFADAVMTRPEICDPVTGHPRCPERW